MSAIAEPPIDSRGVLSAHELARLQRAALMLAALFVGVAFAFSAIAAATGSVLFTGFAALFAWSGIVAIIHYLFLRFAAKDRSATEYNTALEVRSKKAGSPGSSDPPVKSAPWLPDFGARWQWVVLFAGLFAAFIVLPHQNVGALNGESVTALRAAAVIALAAGGLLYFLINFAVAIQQRLKTDALDALLHLGRIAFYASLACAGVTFLFLTTTHDISRWLGWPLLAFPCVLAVETLVRFGARFYQPAALRDNSTPAGSSVILDAVFGRGKGWKNALKNFESLIGARVSEIWILQFLRQIVGLVILATVLLAWFSTCLTAIPAGSRGVRVVLGRYRPVSLLPGLHLTWPQPFERVEIIPTEHVRSISLGFDKDLSGAVLWTEKHVEGEKNLLVGSGETLLTINVPILYRIADPVAFLQTTTDPDEALASLAERKLIQLTGSRDSFAIMTDQRANIEEQLKTALQGEVDRLGLGLKILFVGLKDIHPPVDVALAFEEVVSAEEEKESTIDMARAERARTLPAAKAEAMRLRTTADAAYKQSVAQAEGKSVRFTLIAAAEQMNVGLFRMRVRLDMLEDALAKPTKVILGVPATFNRQFYLDLRNTGDLPPP